MAFKLIFFRLMILSLVVHFANGKCPVRVRTFVKGFGCPDTWELWGNNCYKATAELPWLEAKQECVKMGGVMVVPQSDEVTTFLLTIQSWFWIDCNDLQGAWECQEGATGVGYRNWDNGQPSGEPGQDCALVWSLTHAWAAPGKWNDASCDYQQAAICKQPIGSLWNPI